MARIDLDNGFDEYVGPAPDQPSPNQTNPNPGPNESAYLPANSGAPALGHPSMTADDINAAYMKAFGHGAGADLSSELENANKYGAQGILNSIAARTNNNPGSGQAGSATWANMQPFSMPTMDPARAAQSRPQAQLSGVTGQPYPYSGQFSDPYTQQLEETIRKQLDALVNPGANSPQQMLTDFLSKRFGELSNSNGYSPEEQAILRTQAFEPIEAMRQSANQRILERAGQRGILPSSGVVLDEQASNDRGYDQQRTVMGRDLAIQQINERANRLTQALGLGNSLVQLDHATQQQVLQLATLLHQLPIDAENQALNVINGSGSPTALLSQVAQMSQNQYQNAFQQQQVAQQNSQAMADAIGRAIAQMVG